MKWKIKMAAEKNFKPFYFESELESFNVEELIQINRLLYSLIFYFVTHA